MRAILISVKPKWCEKIASGEKTIEVRKIAPKEVPFKAYIYCTKANKKYQTICGCMVINTDELYRLPNGKIKHDWSGELMCCNGEYTRDNFLNGKVIGEFICDKVEKFDVPYPAWNKAYLNDIFRNSCLTYTDLHSYIGSGNRGYGWHISDLKIYDKPKELSEFKTGCKGCKERDTYHCKFYCYGERPLTRPPKNYIYVEE